MKKIKKLSSCFILICNGLLLGIPSLLVLWWSLVSAQNPIANGIKQFKRTIESPQGPLVLQEISWTPFSQFIGFCADFIGNLPFLVSLLLLKSLFSMYKNGEFFTKKNSILYKNLGILFLIDALITSLMSELLMGVAVTLSNPIGQRLISISFGTVNLSGIFYGVLVIFISWIMQEANKINTENTFTI